MHRVLSVGTARLETERAAGGVRGREDRRRDSRTRDRQPLRNGAKLKDALGQLESVADSRFDIVSCGGARTSSFTTWGSCKATTRSAAVGPGIGEAVVFITTVNVGSHGLLSPISGIQTARTREPGLSFLECRRIGVQYVDSSGKGNEIFLGDPTGTTTPTIATRLEGTVCRVIEKQTKRRKTGRARPAVRPQVRSPLPEEREMSAESG
jgi:hypothetical protein